MHILDWSIVAAVFMFVIFIAKFVQRYTVGVSDFLAANRSAGKYLLSVSDGAATLAAVNILAAFEMYYKTGFVPFWWWMLSLPIGLLCTLSGWCVYRFRETRAMTLAEFFEMRYSRKFRIFSGIVCFVGGLLNFGIFPAIGARFFMNYCGLAPSFEFLGIQISTFVFIMALLLIASLYLTSIGGQVAVIITDFVQGTFCNFIFVVIIIFMLIKFDWNSISSALLKAPDGYSMVNPFKAGKVSDFNFWFFAINAFGAFYWRLSWQGNQAYNCSASTPHDAKMSKILAGLRYLITHSILLFIPICVFTVFNSNGFGGVAEQAGSLLDGIEESAGEQVRLQMTVPVTLSKILPIGIAGGFCAAILSALLSTYDSFMHSWASVLVQDVILPIRQKPLTTRQHMWALRIAVWIVAAFAFVWSCIFQMNQHILMYQAITGAVFIAGSGACIVGGLYWKKGSTAGAWSAMILGVVTSLGLFVTEQVWFKINGTKFPIHGQYALGISCVVSLLSYFIVSYLGSTEFNLDKMLNRGQYSGKDKKMPKFGFKSVGFSKEFSLSDKIVYSVNTGKTLFWFLTFAVITTLSFFYKFPDSFWSKLWRCHIWICTTMSVVFFLWFLVFSLRDLKTMIYDLKNAKRDADDTGVVSHDS